MKKEKEQLQIEDVFGYRPSEPNTHLLDPFVDDFPSCLIASVLNENGDARVLPEWKKLAASLTDVIYSARDVWRCAGSSEISENDMDFSFDSGFPYGARDTAIKIMCGPSIDFDHPLNSIEFQIAALNPFLPGRPNVSESQIYAMLAVRSASWGLISLERGIVDANRDPFILRMRALIDDIGDVASARHTTLIAKIDDAWRMRANSYIDLALISEYEGEARIFIREAEQSKRLIAESKEKEMAESKARMFENELAKKIIDQKIKNKKNLENMLEARTKITPEVQEIIISMASDFKRKNPKHLKKVLYGSIVDNLRRLHSLEISERSVMRALGKKG